MRATESLAAARTRIASDFAAVGIDTAALDARLLVCAAAGVDHAGLIRDAGLSLDAAAAAKLAAYETRRRAGEPVSRILGRREFWGLNFAVTPAVLDPRPETEGLVGSIIDAIGGRRAAAPTILDLGVGSGAILAALLHEMPGARGVGVDLSPTACAVARSNLRALGLEARAMILCGRWSDALAARFDVVVSNPPYIATDDLASLPRDVKDHDPRLALDGGTDGLAAYRALVPRLADLLLPAGTAAFECGARQGEAVATLMRASGLGDVGVYRDLAGLDRVVLGSRI